MQSKCDAIANLSRFAVSLTVPKLLFLMSFRVVAVARDERASKRQFTQERRRELDVHAILC